MYTRNMTGCTCSFDVGRKDCACCADNGCPCGGAYKYQCVRCGFEDKLCGRRELNLSVTCMISTINFEEVQGNEMFYYHYSYTSQILKQVF